MGLKTRCVVDDLELMVLLVQLLAGGCVLASEEGLTNPAEVDCADSGMGSRRRRRSRGPAATSAAAAGAAAAAAALQPPWRVALCAFLSSKTPWGPRLRTQPRVRVALGFPSRALGLGRKVPWTRQVLVGVERWPRARPWRCHA
jgi:hypothetical protein